jgi:VWFA-related protein
MRIHGLVAIAVVTIAARGLAGQGPQTRPQPTGQPPVTFKVEVNYVELDVVVNDAQGTFVGDLTKEDFQVLEEGTPQSITAFSRVELPVERADPPLFKSAVIEPDVRSNHEAFDGRVFLMVLDDLQTDARYGPRVQAAARQFIRRYVGANDIVAVVTTGGATWASQEFTSSKSRLIAAVNKFMGQKLKRATTDFERPSREQNLTRGSSDFESGFRARNTYTTLRNVADYLAAVRGRRKAILWFGQGVDYDIGNPFKSPDADVVRRAMQDVIETASRANVSFYGIDARGLGAGLDESIEISGIPDETNDSTAIQNEVRRGQDSLRSVSSETGGFAVVNQNDLNGAFERIIQENSNYYVLGYYASNDKRDGRFRNVQVRVARPGATVRARKGYTAPKGARPSTAAGKGVEAQMSAEMREALASPIPSRGLGVSMFAAPFVGTAPKSSVALVVEVDPDKLTFVEQGGTFNEDVEIHVLAIDAAGKVQGGGRDVAPLRLHAATHALVVKNGLRVTRRLELPPGRYQIHVGVRDGNGGAIGTIRQDLDLPDFSKEPLLMSGITLTSASASRMLTANPDPGLKDVLPTPPTALREFPRTDTLALFVEVYDNQTAPHRVAINTTVVADDGKVMFTAADERASKELQGQKGGYGITGKIPLGELPPGRYVLRIEARTLLSKGGTAARELEFRVR